VFDHIIHLVENRDRVVSRDDLIKEAAEMEHCLDGFRRAGPT
jgi:hypothetical protein